nr:hypothetical protein L204_02311 [Cryptococcus depauperatus CBS 7855]
MSKSNDKGNLKEKTRQDLQTQKTGGLEIPKKTKETYRGPTGLKPRKAMPAPSLLFARAHTRLTIISAFALFQTYSTYWYFERCLWFLNAVPLSCIQCVSFFLSPYISVGPIATVLITRTKTFLARYLRVAIRIVERSRNTG